MKNKDIYKGPTAENTETDIVIIGSGTGMAAALAAKELGLNSVILEKTELVGGSLARSGGAFWIPANNVLKESGSKDTLQKAEEYLNAITTQGTKPVWMNFLKNGVEAVENIRRNTDLKLFWSKGYSDYHPEEPGGDPNGRTVEPRAFDINKLGKKEVSRLRPAPMAAPIPMPVTGYAYKWMNLMFSKPFKAFPIVFKSLLQGLGGLVIGRRMSAGGEALAAGLFEGVIKKNIPVWTNTEFKEFIFENNRVTGVIAVQNGKEVSLKARKGVILAAGGFDHNMPMRQKFQSPILKHDYSLGAAGNEGDGIFITKNTLEADTSFMKESWWFPAVSPVKEGDPAQVMLAERSLPGSFIVNGKGKRFINEATDYMSFGQTIIKMAENGDEVKEMWIIFDQKYRNKYIFAGSVFPRAPLPEEWYENHIAFKADSPEELAEKAGLPTTAFKTTFNRFNEMAKEGKDRDFHKGESAYDRYYGDPKVKPNPNLRPLEGKTFYAVKMVLSDLGTCGGLTADQYGRVLKKEDKTPINGLYAIGNNSANIFGRVYPGAGGTIAQGLVFGYIVANYIADEEK